MAKKGCSKHPPKTNANFQKWHESRDVGGRLAAPSVARTDGKSAARPLLIDAGSPIGHGPERTPIAFDERFEIRTVAAGFHIGDRCQEVSVTRGFCPAATI